MLRNLTYASVFMESLPNLSLNSIKYFSDFCEIILRAMIQVIDAPDDQICCNNPHSTL